MLGDALRLKRFRFRLKKICDCQKQLKCEISHYQQVAKKYNKVQHLQSLQSRQLFCRQVVL